VEPTPENGLRQLSFVMVDKISTVRKERLDTRIGVLMADDMARIEAALVVFLGIQADLAHPPLAR
jgi:mRNA interferase MazF